ncbi:alpha/beta hydrolase [Paenibacillus albiflavus]|uniref:Alpha/beta hydrolase n=1 Tax=Paenibacillus albiflavus TaxID=2545760 RepID=A0A4R4EGE9_9BACL|nr:alpha/beta hydrolase [Paenibacillus albiflavus]TCZ78220.1 alpha/beta hydrolase [Paenibacillus albiflavus]
MGMFIFFITLILEIALVIYCVVTKQYHRQLRNWVRVSTWIAFILLTLTSVIVWSLRWVLLGVLLTILAVIATISLIRRNQATPATYKVSRIVRNAIMMIIGLTIALAPAVVFPQHKAPKVTGKYEVETATFTYVDENRIEEFTDTGKNRFVNVEFWYPQDAKETYPLLVFSHGAYGIKSSNTSTYTELASHGYVVVSIDHPYHSFYTVSDDGTRTMISSEYMREFNDSNKDGIYTVEELYALFQKWMKLRKDDMNFVIDTILRKTKTDNNPIYQHINTDKIGVFGHSMGGSASVSLGKERKDISAVVNIDAPFFSELVYDPQLHDLAASGEAYTTPLLNIYSDDVWVQLGKNSSYAANNACDKNCKEAYTVYFEGAKHLSLTDLPLFSPMLANFLQRGKANIDPYDCIETENTLILQFFDDKLKGMGSFADTADVSSTRIIHSPIN